MRILAICTIVIDKIFIIKEDLLVRFEHKVDIECKKCHRNYPTSVRTVGLSFLEKAVLYVI